MNKKQQTLREAYQRYVNECLGSLEEPIRQPMDFQQWLSTFKHGMRYEDK